LLTYDEPKFKHESGIFIYEKAEPNYSYSTTFLF